LQKHLETCVEMRCTVILTIHIHGKSELEFRKTNKTTKQHNKNQAGLTNENLFTSVTQMRSLVKDRIKEEPEILKNIHNKISKIIQCFRNINYCYS